MMSLRVAEAEHIIDSLRLGVPPRRGTALYSTGMDFPQAVSKRFLVGGLRSGRIKFVAGSWGAGKTHLFRVLTELANSEGILVSTVELAQDSAAFNRMEQIVGRVVASAGLNEWPASAQPFESVVRDQARRRSGDAFEAAGIDAMCRDLWADDRIVPDVRRVLESYLRTLPYGDADPQAVQDRAILMDWFQGRGTAGEMRRRFSVNSMISPETAREVLSSLGAVAEWLGRKGLLVLLDESEMSHSVMRKSARQKAHNNLLHLINTIGDADGLMLVYAAVPEFWLDEETGIKTYGALYQRIGDIPGTPPRPLRDKVWNIDRLDRAEDAYADVAARIRAIYARAYASDVASLPTEEEIKQAVRQLAGQHPEWHAVSHWRIVVQGAVRILDEAVEGVEALPIERTYRDILDIIQSAEDAETAS
jgi:hypothetical protein